MNYFFDENTNPKVADILRRVFQDDNRISIYSVHYLPFKSSMKDQEIFALMDSLGIGCIISLDKFRGHDLSEFQNFLVFQLKMKEWIPLSVPDQCWRWIKYLATRSTEYSKLLKKSNSKGHVYHFPQSGTPKPKGK